MRNELDFSPEKMLPLGRVISFFGENQTANTLVVVSLLNSLRQLGECDMRLVQYLQAGERIPYDDCRAAVGPGKNSYTWYSDKHLKGTGYTICGEIDARMYGEKHDDPRFEELRYEFRAKRTRLVFDNVASFNAIHSQKTLQETMNAAREFACAGGAVILTVPTDLVSERHRRIIADGSDYSYLIRPNDGGQKPPTEHRLEVRQMVREYLMHERGGEFENQKRVVLAYPTEPKYPGRKEFWQKLNSLSPAEPEGN